MILGGLAEDFHTGFRGLAGTLQEARVSEKISEFSGLAVGAKMMGMRKIIKAMVPVRAVSGLALSGAVLAVACPLAATAGEVAVSFIQPERYTDIGFGQATRQRNLKTLSEHMGEWGAALPASQRLEIEVLDVDLAGVERPVGREPFVRVLNGKVDGPRMSLRWTLREGASVVARGEEQLSDLGYAYRLALGDRNQPLYYDLRMLDAWLRERIIQPDATK